MKAHIHRLARRLFPWWFPEVPVAEHKRLEWRQHQKPLRYLRS
jgi:hypothetical protein